MSKRNEVFRRDCPTCHTGFTVSAADSNHIVFGFSPEGLKDPVPSTITCLNPECPKPSIKLYWGRTGIVAGFKRTR